ncbi:MAG: putative exported protein [Deltaproteobacteria bacterium]|nr:putative exported protein [Deltaproteobacteria bacterium]
MKHLVICVICIFFVISVAASASADNPAGVVKTIKGAASIVRQEKVVSAAYGQKIFSGDTIKTGPDGSLGIIFEDDTLISLGPNSEIIINEFVFAPAQGNMSIVTRMIKGTVTYLSGIIAKLSPQSVKFETPTATLGIRGTRFYAQVEEN